MVRYLIIGIILLSVVGLIILLIYNKLVTYRNKVREAWSGIDIQLRRRYNLIPNLTQTVKGYAEHEQSIFEDLTNTMQSGIDANTVEKQSEAEGALSNKLQNVFAIAAKYPELKANDGFINLLDSINEIEDNIQRARRYYNALVREYNTYIEKFPAVTVANIFGFDEYAYFEAGSELERKNQKIKF